MVLSVQKLARSLKFPVPSKPEDHQLNSDALSSSLRDFRSKISGFISSVFSKPESGSEYFPSLTGLNKCFELIYITDRAFAKLVMEIDYPMSRWGAKATDEYLNYSLSLLEILNLINSSVSHLNQAKMSISHALSRFKNSSLSAADKLKKIPRTNLGKNLRFEGSIRVDEKCCSEKEHVVLEALMVSKKIGFFALGLVLSGLCSDGKPYMEIRKSAGGFDDSLIKSLDLRFCKEIREMEEVKEVNNAIEQLSAAISTEGVKELKRRLELLESLIQGIEKQANKLFSEVLGTRNKLLDDIRITGEKELIV